MQAHAYTVTGLAQGKSTIAELGQFKLKDEGTLPAETLLSPNFSLYSFDDASRSAVFVETPVEVDLTAPPFYYLAQKEHATHVLTVPYKTFNDLAQTLPEPSNLLLLHSVGRCGSTLLCKALGELGEVTTLSEPDVYTCAAGIRTPDGSCDAELVQLLGSATRFLCQPGGSEGTFKVLKFRAWCLEIADLLAQACPDAQALFLYRELEGWIRSMAKSFKYRDPKLEAEFQATKPNFTFGIYPREHFITLLRNQTPETRLEAAALGWTSLMKRYAEFFEQGIIRHALSYDDLLTAPAKALHAVSHVCGLPQGGLEQALEVFEHDSQAGTELSRESLKQQGENELSEEDIASVKRVASSYGVDPDITVPLPGHLLQKQTGCLDSPASSYSSPSPRRQLCFLEST